MKMTVHIRMVIIAYDVKLRSPAGNKRFNIIEMVNKMKNALKFLWITRHVITKIRGEKQYYYFCVWDI